MRQKAAHPKSPSERIVKNIRRATRKRHSSEEKIRIVLDGLRGETSIAELCRREGIAESLYYAQVSTSASDMKEVAGALPDSQPRAPKGRFR